MGDNQSTRKIIHETKKYSEIAYKNEQELERLAVKNNSTLFGDDIIYFDKKTKITSEAKISKIPDGLFISLPNYNDAKFWLVEYELAKHDIEGHIMPQILGFMKALQNEKTKKTIREILYQEIIQNPKSVKKIKSILPSNGEIHHFLENILDKELGLVIVIDKKTPELEEVSDSISGMMKLENQILEFITFESEQGKKIHVIDSLSKISKLTKKPTNEIKDWNVRLSNSSSEIQVIINKLIVLINSEFNCVGKSWHKWYGFYITEPTERKKLFAVLLVGKNTANLRFRINPSNFIEKDTQIRPIKGFFFPTNTERAISLNADNLDFILKLLEHSYKTAKERYSAKRK